MMNWLTLYPVTTPEGSLPIVYSGVDRHGRSNFSNALDFVKDSRGRAVMIGDTPFGMSLMDTANQDAMNLASEALEEVLFEEGIIPLGGDVKGATIDSFWNMGSPDFAKKVLDSQVPAVGFVDGAPPRRGFTNHEAPAILASPTTVMNGFSMDAVTGDPIAFLGDSAATFQQLELDVAGSASFHSGRLVSLREIRSRIDIRYGFDAVNDTLFGRPTKDFITQTVGDMQAGADRWLRRHAQGVGGTPYRTLQEHAQQFALEGAHARGITAIDAGPLPVTSEAAGLQSSRFQAAMDAEFTVNATGAQSPSAGMRVAGSMALASVAADATYTVKRAYELSAAGNHVGTDSTVLHFGSRNLSAWGGAVLGAQTGAALGFETGPGAILTTAVGGIAGGVGGNKIADAIDTYRTYHQADREGQSWSLDPEKPAQGWTRQGFVAPPPGHEPEPPRIQTLTASPELANELNYKASGVQVQLALANPPTPRDPYTQKSDAWDTHSLREADWRRDAQTHQWNRQVTDGYLEHGLARSHRETAVPARAALLDRAAEDVIAENRSNQPPAIADRYLEAHRQFGWDRFGPPEPAAIHASQAPKNVLTASDGDEYVRGRDGEWVHEGVFSGRSHATGNLRDELDASAPTQNLHRHELKRGLDSSLRDADPHQPTSGQERETSQSDLGKRLGRMLEAANQGDWNSFRKDTQAFANMPPGQQLQAHAVAMVDRAEQHEAQLAEQRAQQALVIQQQQQQQQQSPVHRMVR
ncbi:MAG: hypothetical protein ABW137_02515 [Mycobacterium sp.]